MKYLVEIIVDKTKLKEGNRSKRFRTIRNNLGEKFVGDLKKEKKIIEDIYKEII